MDRQLFTAAENGNIEPLNAYQDRLDRLVDADQNTALHIYSSTGGHKVVKKYDHFLWFDITSIVFSGYDITRSKCASSINYVFLRQLLDKCPSLLLQANARGEIPLHVAARHGHLAIVEFLIRHSKEQHGGDLGQMLRMRDKEQNTALHKAARYGCSDVVRVLFKEDLNLLSSVNKSGETPLYMVARGQSHYHHHLVDEMLDYCKSMPDPMLCLIGPCGRTILHAAVLANDTEKVRAILARGKDLTEKGDEDGRTPLHYAAHFGFVSIARILLESDGYAAYITDKKGEMSPLHMAASRGNVRTMELIISQCPGCIGILDKRGWNFLHFALLTLPHIPFYHRRHMYEIMVSLRTRYLLDQKDVDGITPVHVFAYGLAQSSALAYVELALYRIIRITWHQVIWREEYFSEHSEKEKRIEEALNEIGSMQVAGYSHVHQAFRSDKFKTNRERMKSTMEKLKEIHLLVATLVATVTFAAAFTVPGGYKSEQGTAILSRNSAFQAFVITDSLSFISSLSAVLVHFFLYYCWPAGNIWVFLADGLILFAMGMMVIAFGTGLYAVLESSLAFAIAACSIANTIFLLVLCLVILCLYLFSY